MIGKDALKLGRVHLMDFSQSDGGYDISDYRQIDPLFGSMEDLEELLAKAKELGLKVILEIVPNHTSDQHEWFTKSVNRETGFEDFYIWRNCELLNDGTRRVFNNWVRQKYFFMNPTPPRTLK